MYRPGRYSVRERIITAEVMKLERRQAARRGGGRAAGEGTSWRQPEIAGRPTEVSRPE
jgi:hypothetical protein